CQTTYGSALDTSSGNYNQLINGGRYWTELEYSNKLGDCYQLGEPVVSTLAPIVALPGQTVTITGQNFFGPVVVRFNGIVAPVVSVTQSAITVHVPNGSYFGKVTVQALGGIGTSAVSFGSPKPLIASVDPLDGKVGTAVTLTGTNFTSVTGVKFGTIASTYAVLDDGTLTATVPVAFSSGKVTLLSTGGSVVSTQVFQVTKVASFAPSAAKAGALVTISGQGLLSATTVDFPGHDGVAVASTSTTSVRVAVPVDATGPGALVVHTPNIDGAGIATKPFKATPTITSFTDDGRAGSAVTIAGANLGDATAVTFGKDAASFDSPSATSITAYVPANLTSAKITVVTPHGSVITNTPFAVTKVTGLSPAAAPAGSVVTINGQGLGSATSIDFGGATGVAVTSTTATAVKVKVPAGASIGDLVVHTPNIDGTGLATTQSFKPLPRITSFDTNGYQVGDTVTARGTNLAESGAYTAKIGGVAVDGLTVVDGQTLTFRVPPGALSSALTFANAAGSTTSGATVAIRATIASFTPANAAAGTRVTFTGSTFHGTTSVSFGGAKASFSVGAGGSTLTANVPPTAVDGPITVTNAGGSTDTATPFHVDPVIDGFRPASGAVGTTVTVSGTGLKAVAMVDFGGGVSAAPRSTTATSLVVVVPAGATSGPIAVHAGSSSGVARGSFGVTFSVTSLSQPLGVPGATITLSGIGLTNVTSVKFGGLPATITSQSGSSLTVVVPAITEDVDVSVTKGSTTIDSPEAFGLFSVTSAAPHAVTAGGTIHVQGSHLAGAKAKFAGVDTPVTLSLGGNATVPDGFTGGTVTIADAYGDAIDETYALFSVVSYSAAHAGPGDTISIALTDGDYSSAAVHVQFPGAGVVTATGGNGSAQVDVPAGATSGALQVEAGTSGWATGGDFTVDRASVVLSEVDPGGSGAQLQLLATSDGGLGDTTVTWRQGGDTHAIHLAAQSVHAGDVILVPTTIGAADVTIEVATPVAAEDGLALGSSPDTAWLVADGVWGSAGAFDWGGLAVARTGTGTPDDVDNWSLAG
ncbi:MAG TPA: IPT/TIG domain-containing protein, partial [Gaiellaceae bacterium]|nr:IPT/TIG domain-containing protein [Gaiellaceae bacterium]